MDSQIKAILRQLGDALFPLTEWIEERKSGSSFPYVPSTGSTPWRKKGAPALSMANLGVIEFLESLLRDGESATTLIDLWNARRREPLALSPHDDPQGWRKARGLDPEPRFGIFDSKNNWPAEGVIQDAAGNGLSRTAFYEGYFPLLRGSLYQYLGQPKQQWARLSKDLAEDSFAGWPSQEMKSSDFIHQFRIDLLFAMMGMTNPHVPNGIPPEYRDALLVELGEHRRVGDAQTRKTIEATTERFAKAIVKQP